MSKDELAEEVRKLFWDHTVEIQIDWAWGSEEVAHCNNCGYFDVEYARLHAAEIVIEYLGWYYKDNPL